MFKNKSPLLFAFAMVLAAAAAAGCARTIDPGVYRSAAAGETVTVQTGTVISVRPVIVRDSRRLADNRFGGAAGTAVGAAGGAAIGNEIGAGSGNTVATIAGGVLGGVVGGVAGAAVERELTTQTGYEYVIRMISGETVAMIQGGAPIPAGTTVYVHRAAYGRGRIIPV